MVNSYHKIYFNFKVNRKLTKFNFRITLFDPEDDNYDGDFLEDDNEVPRVLLNF